MSENEISEATKTLSASELQVQSLADQSKKLNQQAKQLKARQGLAKTQTRLFDVNQPFNS